jgi:hypothetical protein
MTTPQKQESFGFPVKVRLSQRKELFANLVAGFCAPDIAYLRSGYRSAPQFARANAARLLRDESVLHRIDELRASFRAESAITLERIQQALLPVLESNLLNYLAPKGRPQNGKRRAMQFKSLNELRYEEGLALAGVKLNDDGQVVDLKLHGKSDAARTLLVSIGLGGGEDGALAAATFGAKLGEALARAKDASKLIEGEVIDDEKAPAPAVPAPQKFDW